MATYTPNLNLKKPDYTDLADVADFNANMDIIDGKINEILGVKTATIGTTWVGDEAPYTQTITVAGITPDDEPIISPVYSTTNATAILQKEAWNMVGKIVTGEETITVTCFEEKPTIAIPIQIKGV